MKNYNPFSIKTLQGKLIVLLLAPVFLTIFIGGTVSFFYSRNKMLAQWNESAILKLQRAAHDLESRILKPIEMIALFYKLNPVDDIHTSQKKLSHYVAGLEGVVKAEFKTLHSVKGAKDRKGRGKGTRRFGHSRLLKITEPRFDTNAGHETISLVLSLLNSMDEIVGNFEVVMRFDYLLKDLFTLGWLLSEQAAIVDENGTYIVQTHISKPQQRSLKDSHDPLELSILQKMDRSAFGTVTSAERPPETIVGFCKLDNIPWTIIMFAKGEKILEPIVRYRNAVAGGGAGLILFILLLIRFQASKVVKRIERLSNNARKVAKGDYSELIPVETQDEIGHLILSYNSMIQGLKERDFIRDTFGRYIDPDFAKTLLAQPDAGKLGGTRKNVAILMSDIRGFTPLSETLDPEVIIHIINRYFSHMIRVIQHHNGIIVDFIGDAILVFFETVSGTLDDTIENSIRCAEAMQKEMFIFNTDIRSRNLPELEMGIGVNAGQVIVGNIGSESRAKYGIVGSAVNITSRIQGKSKPGQILISQDAFVHVKDKITIEDSFETKLKGVEGYLQLHAVKI